MKSIINPVSGDPYPSADYELLESRALGMRVGSGSTASASSDDGGDAVSWWHTSGVADANLRVVDANHDWRNRVVEVAVVELSAADRLPRGANSYNDMGAVVINQYRCAGWLGTGAYSNVGGSGTAVSAGAAPLAASGGVVSYRLTIATGVYLFAHPTTGALWIYNASGSTIHYLLIVRGTGAVAA